MKQDAYLILQMVAEADRALSRWADYVSRDQLFELGRDPAVVGRIEQELEQLYRQLGELGGRMKPGLTPMQQARYYYAARGELQKTTTLLRDIRLRNQGSARFTAHFLSQAESCRYTLHQWASLLQKTASTHLH